MSGTGGAGESERLDVSRARRRRIRRKRPWKELASGLVVSSLKPYSETLAHWVVRNSLKVFLFSSISTKEYVCISYYLFYKLKKEFNESEKYCTNF